MALSTKDYRFKIGNTRLYPINSLSFKWEKVQNEKFKRKKIEALTFADVDDEDLDDFTFLWGIENSSARCEKIELKVDKKCGSTWHSDFFKGYLHMVDGTWNLSKCMVDIPVRANDKYTQVYDNWQKPVNVFEFIDQDDLVTLSTLPPGLQYEIEAINCYNLGETVDLGAPLPPIPKSPPPPCEGNSSTWSLLQFGRKLKNVFDGPGPPVGKRWATVGVYVRIVAISEDKPGEGWTKVEGNWVKAPNVGQKPTPDEWNQIGSDYWRILFDGLILDKIYDNGIKMEDFMTVLVEQTIPDMTIESSFFGINKAQTGDSDPYKYAQKYFSELVVYQKTDIKYADAEENATSFIGTDNPLTLKKVLDDFKNWANVYWYVEKRPGKDALIIEHDSFFQNTGDWDMTEGDFDDMMKDNYSFSYLKNDLVKSESFTYMDDISSDFKGVPIFYDNACVNDVENLTEKTYKCNYTNNDLPFMVSSPDEVDVSGIVFVAAKEEFTLIREDFIPVVKKFQLNGCLSYYNLVPSLFLWSRPQISGFVNNTYMLFYSQKRQRKLNTMTVHLCCDNIINLTTQDKYTRVGWCEIERITLEEPGGIVKFDFIF